MICEPKQNLNLSANRRRNFNGFNLERPSMLVAWENRKAIQNKIYIHFRTWNAGR